MGVEFEMYALPSFSSCWDEDVLKFLYWLILAFDLKFEMSFMYSESNCGLNAYWFKKEDCCKGGGGGRANLHYFPRDILYYICFCGRAIWDNF